MYGAFENQWAVVGFSHDQALKIMQNIEQEAGKVVIGRVRSRNSLRTLFDDGTILEWIPAAAAITRRGYKFGRMWCDNTLDTVTLHEVVYPLYFGNRDSVVWL